MEDNRTDRIYGKIENKEIDESMLEMNEFVSQMSDLEGYLYDEDSSVFMHMDKVDLSMPIQLDLRVTDDGQLKLGSSPPLYYADTSVMPVFHQMSISIKLTENKYINGDSHK